MTRNELSRVTVAKAAAGPCSICYKYAKDYFVLQRIIHPTPENGRLTETMVPHIFCAACIDRLRKKAEDDDVTTPSQGQTSHQ